MSFIPTISDVYVALKSILNVLSRPLWVNTSGQAQVAVVAGTLPTVTTVGTVTTCGTVTTVTSVAQFSGMSTYYNQIVPHERTNWASAVRSRIS